MRIWNYLIPIYQNLKYTINDKNFLYWIFYVNNVYFEKKNYIIEIIKTSNKQKIYNNLVEV